MKLHVLVAADVRTLSRTTQFFNNQKEARNDMVEDMLVFDTGLVNGHVVVWSL